MRKGLGGGERRLREELAVLLDGSPSDTIVAAIARLAEDASGAERAAAALLRLLDAERGGAAGELALALAGAAYGGAITEALGRGRVSAKQAIVAALPFEASVADRAVDAILDAFLKG